CANPSNLINSCNEYSRIGKLESGNPDVEIRFMCRHYNETNNPNDTNFQDIAVIQHNKSTGATCFYQSPTGGNLNGARVAAPRTGETIWYTPSSMAGINCAGCHDNRGFIKTGHLKGVTGYHEIPAPPRVTNAYSFPGEATKNWRVYEVKANNNPACSSCHTMGSFNNGPTFSGSTGTSGSSGALGLQSARNDQFNMLPGTSAWMPAAMISSAEAHRDCASNHFGAGCQVRQYEAFDYDDNSPATTSLSWVQLTGAVTVRAGDEIGRLTYSASGGDGLISYSVGHPENECSWDWPRPENGQMIITGKAPASGRFTLSGKEIQPGNNICNIRLIAQSAGQTAELNVQVTIQNGQASTGLPYDGQVLTLRSRHSGKCLDLDDGSLANGANIQQWDCNGGNAQKFRFQADGKGAYALVNLQSNKCVSVKDFTQDDGGRVHSWDCYGNADQKYRLVP
ncbi:MAG: hypothetical protein EOP07_25140, partial [Proteobacteria bacterium]